MVKGLDLFAARFKDFEGQFVLIGGAACYLALEDAGLPFRATKDLDIVLCVEALNRSFVEAFWDFIRTGGYEVQEQAGGGKQFYRFKKPHQPGYPFMLELFSRAPDVIKRRESQHLAAIPVEDEAVSLSAILLNDDYYAWILQGKRLLRDVPIVTPEHIIPLKARAWVDLTTKKAAGYNIESQNIKKHKNDVFRLVAVISQVPISVPDRIKNDMRVFCEAMHDEEVDLKAMGLGLRGKEEVLHILERKYGL